jgi:hypothetical protein
MPTANDALIHDMLDSIDATFNSGILTIRTGSAPGAGSAASGTVLATLTLPVDAFNAAASRQKTITASFQDTSADATGTAGHWRLVNSGGTRILEGSVGVGSGELQLSTLSIIAGGTVTITAFTLGFSTTA